MRPTSSSAPGLAVVHKLELCISETTVPFNIASEKNEKSETNNGMCAFACSAQSTILESDGEFVTYERVSHNIARLQNSRSYQKLKNRFSPAFLTFQKKCL